MCWGGVQLLLALSPTSRSLGLRRAHRRIAASASLPTCTRTCTVVRRSETERRTQAVDSSAFMSSSHVAHAHVRAGESVGLHLLLFPVSGPGLSWWWWGGGEGGGAELQVSTSGHSCLEESRGHD